MSKFYVLTLGEFIHQEGINIALESFAGLYHDVTSKHQRKMQLTLISKGLMDNYIQEKMTQLEIEDAVEIVPWSEQQVIEDWYEQASIMLLPSKENISKFVTEAFSFGLPVVCYQNEKLNEIIDSTCGMTIDFDNFQNSVSSFSRILRILYFDPEARKILKKGALRKYESQFSWGLV